jgi:hypothetical protein
MSFPRAARQPFLSASSGRTDFSAASFIVSLRIPRGVFTLGWNSHHLRHQQLPTRLLSRHPAPVSLVRLLLAAAAASHTRRRRRWLLGSILSFHLLTPRRLVLVLTRKACLCLPQTGTDCLDRPPVLLSLPVWLFLLVQLSLLALLVLPRLNGSRVLLSPLLILGTDQQHGMSCGFVLQSGRRLQHHRRPRPWPLVVHAMRADSSVYGRCAEGLDKLDRTGLLLLVRLLRASPNPPPTSSLHRGHRSSCTGEDLARRCPEASRRTEGPPWPVSLSPPCRGLPDADPSSAVGRRSAPSPPGTRETSMVARIRR